MGFENPQSSQTGGNPCYASLHAAPAASFNPESKQTLVESMRPAIAALGHPIAPGLLMLSVEFPPAPLRFGGTDVSVPKYPCIRQGRRRRIVQPLELDRLFNRKPNEDTLPGAIRHVPPRGIVLEITHVARTRFVACETTARTEERTVRYGLPFRLTSFRPAKRPGGHVRTLWSASAAPIAENRGPTSLRYVFANARRLARSQRTGPQRTSMRKSDQES